ncbi:hypothetical protein IV487_12985 [Enterococcus saccharolyticus]|uniref:hypothetical protein n=1 Tax=Enterococcus TaxID=1350 RepID=UPI001E2E58D5|nr:hypothetical protein [Enterococcus saccharolyticus]MCD5003377.1 hypothetical protein [Enterococcus saccharolyticus]
MKKTLLRISAWLFIILILACIGTIIVLNNLNLSDFFGLNEYQTVETRHQLIRWLPYIWCLILTGTVLTLLIIGLKKRTKNIFYWLISFLLIPGIFLFVGISSTIVPIDQHVFRDEQAITKYFNQLKQKNPSKNEDILVESLSLHTRNPILHSGNYAVVRWINNDTQLQDEYWFHPTNLFMKWKKDSSPTTINLQHTISFDTIDFTVVPRIIKETEARIEKKDVYYTGVSIVVLVITEKQTYWSVGVDDVRGYTKVNMKYTLDGTFISED